MFRDQFLVPSPGCYALTHSVGCLPRSSADSLQADFLEPWGAAGGEAWTAWLAAIDGFRSALAALLGGSPDDYCPQVNLSSGLAKFLTSLPLDRPRGILLASEDSFPSLGYVLERAERLGFKSRLLPRMLSPANLSTWSDALTPEVTAVLVTQVHSNTGLVAPVAEVARLCRANGSYCIVDVAQSAGILPICLPEFGADVVLGSCVKWLCGGPGAGFIWIDPELSPRLEPIDVGWFSHADPFEFDIHDFRYAAGARRFWGGTPSVAPYAIAAAGLRTLAQIGVGTLRAYNLELMSAFHAALPGAWRDRVPLQGIGGTLCIDMGRTQSRISEALRTRAVRFDSRGSVARLSFHVYNTQREAEAVADCWKGA